MKQKFIDAFMDVAERFSQLSSATRLKVGAIVVKDERIISIGYNGMPSGWTNECEEKEYMPVDAGGWLDSDDILTQWPFEEEYVYEDGHYTDKLSNGLPDPKSWELTGINKTGTRRYRLKSKSEVLHAEANALMKLASSTENGKNATLFCTHSPCIDCAKLIYQSGISTVYYKNNYRSTQGIEFLNKSGVTVINI